MTEPWILAIDLGNGGPKVGAISPAGRILATAFRPTRVEIGQDGAATQDAEDWWRQTARAVEEVLSGDAVSGAEVIAVAITGQWGSTVPVDAQGRPVGPVLLWADTRGGRYVRDIVGGRLNVSGYAPQKVLPFVRVTGGAPTPSGADPTGHSQLLQRELPEVYAQAAVLLEPVDYLGMRFTGRAAATPASMILSWLTDNRVGATPQYVPALVRRARRDPARLPPLRPTGSVLGTVTREVAEQLGIAVVPVVCGIPDLHAAVLASGTIDEYETHYAVSTTAWFSARVPFKKTDILHSIATVPGLDQDRPVVANNHETGGSALQWLREQVIAPADGLLGGGSGIGDAGAAPERADPTYDDLTALAARAPAGCEGVVFAPWLAGERSPVEDKLLGAAFLNLSLRTDRATLVRAVLEGVAYNARWLFDHYQKFLGRDVARIRIIGGGARSPLWNQIHADVLGVRVEVVEDPANAQLRGVALWARIALGELSLVDVPALVPVSAVHEPDPVTSAEYSRIYREYQGLYKRLSPVSRRLNRPGRS